jgi:hypothetical protein
MASPQFIEYVQKELDIYKETYGFSNDRLAFEPWALQYILGLDRDVSVNNTDTLLRGDDGLDGWYYDDENNIFHIFQMKYPDDLNSEYNGTAGEELITFFNKLIIENNSFKNKKLQFVYDSYYNVKNPDIKIKLNIVIFSQISNGYKESLSKDLDNLNLNPLYEIFDIEKLYNMYIDENDMEELTGKTIPFKILNGRHIEVPSNEEESIGKATVVTLLGKPFAEIVKENYPHIVAKNVRFHLGKTKNQSMINLLNSPENYKFWYYNNGITILCDNWDINSQDEEILLTNPQIINGGQTSKTLSENIEFLNDKTYVLAKIIQLGTNPEKAKSESLKIAETSNTQNKVTVADLKALCPIQKAIKANFDSLDPKWYYEIKNKEWNVLTKADKKAYGKRKLNKTDIGQEWRMVKDNPIEAISKKEEMYTNNKLYTKVFSANRDVYEYLYAHHVVEMFTKLINEENLSEIVHYDKHMNKVFLTRILSAKKMSIGYMSYLLNLALTTEFKVLDYKDICEKVTKDIEYFETALKIIIMSFRKTVKDIDMSESLLNNLRQQEILDNCIMQFNDNYSLMTNFGNNKIFS